jgi:hypothetical protein
VESPIGPFFGQGWDETYPWASLPLSASPVKGNAMVCYFKMPFATGAKIEIENQSDVTINAFYYSIDYVQMEKPKAAMGYFHAWYNHQVTRAAEEGENEWSLLDDEVGKNPAGERNYKILETKGKGHYVGVNYFVNSPTPVWYGEGDDMFFIDGDEMPTLNGTGTEDYFNSSWCPNEKYQHPYYGYAHTPSDIGWLGRSHCYRFHIDDPIYFDKSLRFTIEHGHNNYLTLELASVAYWYLEKPSRLEPIPGKEERKLMPVINYLDMHRWRHEWRKNIGPKSNPWGNHCRFRNRITPENDRIKEPKIIEGNAQTECSIKLGTFIPKILAIRVGIIRMIEMSVSCFITTFRLLEITDAKASIIPLWISE